MTDYRTNLENLIENGTATEKILEAIDTANKEIYSNHCKLLASSEKPLATLYEKNICVLLSFDEDNHSIKEKEKKVKANDVEKEYRLIHSKENSKANGKPLQNKDVTMFLDWKVHTALQAFIKKCNGEITKEIFTFDNSKFYDNTKKVDFSNIMDSNTALDTAINKMLSIMGITATYKKKYNDSLKHYATKQRVNAKGITISDVSVYDLMDYIIDCCKDKVTVKLSYMKEVKQK